MTGLIYAAIVVAWAAYLVPMALRRHDEKVRARSVDRFSAAMRVLARRPGEGLSARPPAVTVQAPPLARGLTASARTPHPAKGAGRVAAARRRRVLWVLLTLTVATGAAVVAGLLPWGSVFGPVAVVLAFLAVCRRQVRRRCEAYWAGAGVGADGATPVRRAIRVEASFGERSGVDPDEEPTVVLRRQEPRVEPERAPEQSAEPQRAPDPLAEPQYVVPVAVSTSDGQSLWDPLPVTLPTYLSKPPAPRVVRTVALGEPGTWTSGRREASPSVATPVAEQPSEAAVEEAEPRRAVGS